MPKAQRNDRSGRYEVTPRTKSRPATVTDKETGETFPLEGYGSMKGQFSVREGVDLAKPIWEQVKDKLERPVAKAKSKAVAVAKVKAKATRSR